MFQSLRANNQFYILHKDSTPYVEVGTVISVSAPIPKFPSPMQPFGQPQEMTVDVVARVKENTLTFQKLPANADIADFGAASQMVLATSKEAINAEIGALRQKSVDIINSVSYHQTIIEGCDKTYSELNPEFAQKQQQAEEINTLKTQVGEITKNMNVLMEMNKELMAQLAESGSKRGGTSKKE